ncbi:hypothetical protein BbiDN127_I0014 (plasmid) [Borreliella bissettiae DN127]|uniref:Uncharacterized protein n=1 Tax=Borrelia bissettiae (strain DSM 17990 / CIP 109136 / DN127) TaxID=521010 RepID=G0AP71_BORBD|nr:hypothetical protein BbiDN127_I0014 [Borreliella bissettiae DN127]
MPSNKVLLDKAFEEKINTIKEKGKFIPLDNEWSAINNEECF